MIGSISLLTLSLRPRFIVWTFIAIALSFCSDCGLYRAEPAFAAPTSGVKVPERMHFSKIYYFGYEGLDLKKIEAAMPLKEGTELAHGPEALPGLMDQINKAVQAETGKKATDIAPVFYQKSWTMYIGLPGTSSQAYKLNPVPGEKTELPKALMDTYGQTMDANVHALETGLPEDRAKYNQLREESKEQAKNITEQLMHVLAKSSDPRQRTVAAHCLGLVAHTESQIKALAAAANDQDSCVRNDAVRALGVIAYDRGPLARFIPAGDCIKLLSSGTWSDRNKGSFVLEGMIKDRDPKLIEALRLQAVPALKEMAGWDLGHSSPALEMLGAIANIPEDKLKRLIEEGKYKEIIDSVK